MPCSASRSSKPVLLSKNPADLGQHRWFQPEVMMARSPTLRLGPINDFEQKV